MIYLRLNTTDNEMPQNKAYDQGLHFWPLIQQILNSTLEITVDGMP